MNIVERIQALRQIMTDKKLDAYIITGADPHGSEIPHERWQTRKWICGFTGSAGTVVITQNGAGLWTDFRYWIQAALELEGSGVELFKEKSPGVPPPEDWLLETLSPGGRVGIDGRTLSVKAAEKWQSLFSAGGLEFQMDVDFVPLLWEDRPPNPQEKVWILEEARAGESRSQRLERLQEALKEEGANTMALEALDAQAWLLNLRGGDIPGVPAALGYLLISPAGTTWFTPLERLDGDIKEVLAKEGVKTAPYQEFYLALTGLGEGTRIFMDPQMTSQALLASLPPSVAKIIGKDPVSLMKACKNAVEISQTRKAMIKDGLALVRFLAGLEKSLEQGESIDEVEAGRRLHLCRQGCPGFLGNSFEAIVAYGPHGAINHYHAVPESAAALIPGEGILLLDSGGHWEEGTTDITRTITLGKPTPQQIHDYTCTLKGHITLSRLRFPQGTRGYQLDAITRAPLWEQGIDFGHGVGHGVGYLLNVHEGPQRLNGSPVDQTLEPGMIVSNEPGTYREDSHGIRIENLLLCRELEETPFGIFYAFETLSLAPYDHRLIDVSLLSSQEREWVNDYHKKVGDLLLPELAPADQRWLQDQTAPL